MRCSPSPDSAPFFGLPLQGKGAVEPGQPATDEHSLLDDNRYIADVMYDFKVRTSLGSAASLEISASEEGMHRMLLPSGV